MIRIIFLALIFTLSSCSIGGWVSDSVTSTRSASDSSQTGAMGPYEIGSVDTAFQLIGPDHQIEVGGVPDPKVKGITCYYSRAKKWGISGGLGLAEDTSDASVSCRKTGDISFVKAIVNPEEIWNESTSFFFKKLRIVRFYDANSNSLVYLVYSDRLIDGSPKNSISAVSLEGVVPLIEK